MALGQESAFLVSGRNQNAQRRAQLAQGRAAAGWTWPLCSAFLHPVPGLSLLTIRSVVPVPAKSRARRGLGLTQSLCQCPAAAATQVHRAQ